MELVSVEGKAGEAADHEAEVPRVCGGGNGVGSHDGRDIGREDPRDAEGSGGEAEDDADDGCGSRDELLVAAVVEVERSEAKEWSCQD